MSRLVCAIFLLLLAINLASCESDDVLNEKIIIVGGGISGFAAASKLLQHGYENIVILEAENRVGGRIWSKCDGSKCLEFGAQWIMGDEGNVAFDLVKKASVIGNKLEDYDSVFVKSNGDSIDKEKIFPYMKLYDEIVSTFQNRNETISELFNNHIEQIESIDVDKNTLKNFFKLLVESITPVTDWNRETGGGLKSFEKIGGSTAIYLSTRMDVLLQILMGTSFSTGELSTKWRNIVHLGAKVKRISWNQSKPLVQYSKVSKPSKIKTVEAEHVIVTLPLGVLKAKYQNLFEPSLPDRKVTAIKSLSYGSVNKVFLTFDRQWWPNNTNFYVIWNDVDIQQLTDSDKWLTNIVGLFPEVNYPTILTAWFVEKDNSLSETLSDAEISTKLTNFIKKAFANQGWTITDPIETQRTKWFNNPNFRGSYSFRGLEASRGKITNADLRESLKNENGKQTVLFAGEATHEKYYSTLHGAIESGFKAADEIVNLHKNL